MKRKNLICLLLSLVLLVSVFAGCGDTQEAASAAPAASEGSAETAVSAEAAPAPDTPETGEPVEAASAEEPAEAPEDLPDLTVQLPLTEEEASYSYYVSFPPPIVQFYENPFKDYECWIELENRTGVTIDWIPVSVEVETEQFYLQIASGDYPDMFGSALLTNSMDFYYEEGVVRDIKEAAETYMPNYLYAMEEYPALAESVGIESDEGRWLLLHSYTKNTSYNGGMVIRQDWLDELGAEAPETIDEYHDILSRFRDELGASSPMWINCDGMLVNDLFASAYGVKSFYNSRGQLEYPIYQVDGEVLYGPAQEGYRDYLQTMAEWYQEGLIYKDFYSYTESNTNAPQDLILGGQTGLFTSQLMNMNQYNDQMDIQVAGAITPVLNKGDMVHFDWREAGATTNGLCISTAVEEAELPLLLRLWDYTMSEEGQLLANWGVEGVTFEYGPDGEPYFTETVTESPLPAFSMAINVNALGTTAVSIIDKSREYCNYEDNQMEAMEIWDSNIDGAWDLPDLMTLNADESEVFAAGFSDILTYVSSFTLSVITGQQALDDASWDAYLSNLESMGLSSCVAQYQSAYDRYMEKTA